MKMAAPLARGYCFQIIRFLVNKSFNGLRSVYGDDTLLHCNLVLDQCIKPKYLVTSELIQSRKLNSGERMRKHPNEGPKEEAEEAEKKKKKSVPIIKIAVIDENKIHMMTKEEARRLCDKRRLSLIEIPETDKRKLRSCATFLLVSESQLFEEEKRIGKGENKKNKSDIKLLMLNSQIENNDLQIKIKKMRTHLEKGLVVKIYMKITGSVEKARTVAKTIESSLKDLVRAPSTHYAENHAKILLYPVEKRDKSNTPKPMEFSEKDVNNSSLAETIQSTNDS